MLVKVIQTGSLLENYFKKNPLIQISTKDIEPIQKQCLLFWNTSCMFRLVWKNR